MECLPHGCEPSPPCSLKEGGGSAGEIVPLYGEPEECVCMCFERYCHFMNVMLYFSLYFQNTLQHRFMAPLNQVGILCLKVVFEQLKAISNA